MLASALLAGCPVEPEPQREPYGGTAGVPTDFMGAGGAPPIAGTTAAVAGTVVGGAAGIEAGMASAGATPVPMGGTGEVPVGGASGTGMVMGRIFDAGSDPARNNVIAGQLCGRLAQIQCAGEAFCCEQPGRDVATCEAAMRASCIEEAFLDAISGDPITAFDPSTAATTFTELERLSSLCDPNIVAFGISRDGLMSMFRGTAAIGDSCSSLSTNPALAAAKLASCADINTVACLPMSLLSWRCAQRGGAGAQCFTDVNCADGFYCPNPDLMIGSHQCAERKPAGAQCQWANECVSLFCEGGVCVEPTQARAYCLAQYM